jgi:hypothetical protein
MSMKVVKFRLERKGFEDVWEGERLREKSLTIELADGERIVDRQVAATAGGSYALVALIECPSVDE